MPLADHNLTGDIRVYAVQNVTEIATQEQLAAIGANETTLAGKYILLNDIDLDENGAGFAIDGYSSGWVPIGGYDDFTGIFNGDFHKITNLWSGGDGEDDGNGGGLFNRIIDAQIRNLGVEIAKDKAISGSDQIGGIAGIVDSSTIINSYVIGNINSTGIDGYVGGIAGRVEDSFIINSYFIGNVNSIDTNVGGIAGAIEDSVITNCYSVGNISGKEQLGGITGTIDGYSLVSNSYSNTSVAGDDYYIGAIGGIGGYIGGYSIVQNNTAVNTFITGTQGINRIAGYISDSSFYNDPVVSSNFAWEGIVGSFTDAGEEANNGISKTMIELKTRALYESLGWKFGNDKENPWKISPTKNNGLPYLYWQEL